MICCRAWSIAAMDSFTLAPCSVTRLWSFSTFASSSCTFFRRFACPFDHLRHSVGDLLGDFVLFCFSRQFPTLLHLLEVFRACFQLLGSALQGPVPIPKFLAEASPPSFQPAKS